ncbi:MAG: hypothetical protein J0H54_00470 [Rhizobiales bacterium]|nr:hypothetical protein [Hyphomicrobiales bacterium]
MVIESDRMRVAVEPDFGARVVSLLDRSSARDWIFPGSRTDDVGEDAVYGADAAVGWDECFPTVSPWDASATMWGRPLRDHGELWGRPWQVAALDDRSLVTHFSTREFVFERRLALEDATLAASYRVENRTGAEMPFLWAMHGLLAPRPGDRIALPGRTALAATYLVHDGRRLDLPMLPWPDGTPALGFHLDEVQPEAAGFAGKFYGEGGIGRAALGRDGEWLVIAWQAPIDALGVWLNYGGWPEPPRGHHLALEPTTAAADHLGQALAAGRAARIAPGGTATWTITLTLARTPS